MSKPEFYNRKYATHSDTINHNGTSYYINICKTSGCYTKILHKSIEQLEICLDRYNRVLVIRFDLHQNYYADNSDLVSKFFKNLKPRLKNHYKTQDIGYVWGREKEKAKAQHYHCAIYLDGNKVNRSHKVLNIIKDTWMSLNGNNHVSIIKNPYYFIDSEAIKKEAVYRISYIAKERGKGYRAKQANDYSTSRLKLKKVAKLR